MPLESILYQSFTFPVLYKTVFYYRYFPSHSSQPKRSLLPSPHLLPKFIFHLLPVLTLQIVTTALLLPFSCCSLKFPSKLYFLFLLMQNTLYVCSIVQFPTVSNCLQPSGLQPARLLCPQDFPGKRTGMGCHFLLQGMLLTQGWSPYLLYQQEDSLPPSHLGNLTLTLSPPKTHFQVVNFNFYLLSKTQFKSLLFQEPYLISSFPPNYLLVSSSCFIHLSFIPFFCNYLLTCDFLEAGECITLEVLSLSTQPNIRCSINICEMNE